jgi:diguanylate cyclase (GGDEF)-like protein
VNEWIVDKLLHLHQQTPVLVSIFDEQDRLQYANPAFCQAYNVAAHERLSWADIMRRNHRERVGARVMSLDIDGFLTSAQSRRGKRPFRAFETDLWDGRWMWMTETLHDGCMLCIASDITHVRADERLLREDRDRAVRAARSDELTGAGNRRQLFDQLQTWSDESSNSSRSPGCVVLIDLDQFKNINDLHGHPAGDAVLKDFVHRVQALLRRQDSLGRIGGEEFMLLLPEMTTAEAANVVRRLMQGTATARPLDKAPEMGYTWSAGVAEFNRSDTVQTAYEKADTALYQAKKSGGNQVQVHQA